MNSRARWLLQRSCCLGLTSQNGTSSLEKWLSSLHAGCATHTHGQTLILMALSASDEQQQQRQRQSSGCKWLFYMWIQNDMQLGFVSDDHFHLWLSLLQFVVIDANHLDNRLKCDFLMVDAEFGAAWMQNWFTADYEWVIKNHCHS